MKVRPSTAINTRSGRILDLADPIPEAVTLEDIAGGLSLAPRFGGQALAFRSVAEHAVCVAELVVAMGFPELALPALHHDSHEAYACDIPRPLKQLLEPAYGGITAKLDKAIAAALKLPCLDPASEEGRQVKLADDAMFIVEAERFLPGDVPIPDVSEQTIELARGIAGGDRPLTPDEAQKKFLMVHAAHSRTP